MRASRASSAQPDLLQMHAEATPGTAPAPVLPGEEAGAADRGDEGRFLEASPDARQERSYIEPMTRMAAILCRGCADIPDFGRVGAPSLGRRRRRHDDDNDDDNDSISLRFSWQC